MYRKYFQNKKTVIFDLDDTVVDTAALWMEAINTIIKRNGGVGLDEVYYGYPLTSIWNDLLDMEIIDTSFTVKELCKETKNIFMDMIKSSALTTKSGFLVLLLKLKEQGIKVALATNTDRAIADAVMKKVDILDMFDFVIYGDSVTKPKPDPEIYLKTLSHFRLPPKDALVFEDSLPGAEASVAAKIDTLVVWNQQVEARVYPGPVLGFISDFTDMVYNLEKDYGKEIEDMVRELKTRTARENVTANVR